MSRKATNEYIGIKRRAYAQAGLTKRMRILDDVCETTGYERKYANRLPTGSRKFREHKGRGKTYGDEVVGTNRVRPDCHSKLPPTTKQASFSSLAFPFDSSAERNSSPAKINYWEIPPSLKPARH